MAFRLKGGEELRLTPCAVGASTVIAPGELVALDTGLIIKATAASTRVAWCPKGSANGETVCEITVGNDFTLTGTADANFAVAQKGTAVDLFVTGGGAQQIDVGENTTQVLRVGVSKTAGTVGSPANVEVRIEKPLF